MKTATIIVLFIWVLVYIIGLVYHLQGNELYYEKAIGYGTLILFFIWMPLFLSWRYLSKYSKEKEEIE